MPYGKCSIGPVVKHYLVVYPKHGAMIGLLRNFQMMKVNKMSLKKNSEIWKLAKKLSKRKHCLWKPIELLPDNTVKVYSIIRGNDWNYDLATLKLLDKRKVNKHANQTL